MTFVVGKEIKKPGAYGRKPGLGWKCTVKLKCDRTDIDSDYLPAADGVVVVTVGDGDWAVDRAIESCLETMLLHEESSFRVRPTPEGEELSLDIHLIAAEERNYIFQWTDEDKYEASKSYKADGVDLFKSNRLEHAFWKFSKALKMLLLMDSDLRDADTYPEENNTLVSLYNNMANCQFQRRNYAYAVELCGKSLSVAPNVKGYFRRALAYIELKEYEKAENDLLALLKMEPRNTAAIEKYKLVRDLDKHNRDNYEAVVRNMFR